MLEQLKDLFPQFYRFLQMEDADVCDILPGASEEEISEIESSLNLILPDSYKNFLRCTRGLWTLGLLHFGPEHPWFHDKPTPSPSKLLQALGLGGVPKPRPSDGMLCFADYFLDADGDQLLFDVSGGLVDGEYPVLYYAHDDSGAARPLADSFGQWLEIFGEEYQAIEAPATEPGANVWPPAPKRP